MSIYSTKGKIVNGYYSDIWSFTKKLFRPKLRILTLVLANLFIVSILLIRNEKSSQVWKGKKAMITDGLNLWEHFCFFLNHYDTECNFLNFETFFILSERTAKMINNSGKIGQKFQSFKNQNFDNSRTSKIFLSDFTTLVIHFGCSFW